MTLNSKGFSRLVTIVCAFVLPTAVLLYLHFVQGSGSWTELAIVGGVFLVGAALAIRAAHAELSSLNELEWKVEGIRKTRHIFEYKPDGTIVYVNPKSLELLGYSSDQCVGRHHSMLIAPEDAKSAEYREMWSRLARGESVEKRHTRKSSSGKDVHVISRYTPIYGLDGKVCKIIDWLTDLTSAHQEQSAIVEPLAAGLKRLAEGDLTTRITDKLQGEYDGLRVNFNAALDRLQDTVCKVLRDATNISSGAAEISQAADDLSRRTEQQAASLEETAAALEEITATVKSTATNAREARTSVTTAKSAAEEGGRVVETAITAMDEIAQSSKKITDIISVIDEIAFQTNLLALNAGVEAARAGDAGRGFAVVASEVRALAQRSGEAAKQIKTLIHASGEHVESGVKYVGESGAALKRIVEQVVQINALVSEMALAAEQQSTGIEEVNSAVTQMDQVTQQNAAMVEQSTAASRQLANEAQSLSQSVSFFHAAQSSPSGMAPSRQVASAPPSTRPAPAMRPAKTRRAGSALAAKPKVDPDDWAEF